MLRLVLPGTVRAFEGWELQWVANNHSFDHVSQHIKEAAALLCAVSPTKLTFKQTYLTVFPARPMLRKEESLAKGEMIQHGFIPTFALLATFYRYQQ